MKNKVYIVAIAVLGSLLIIQAAYIISLERSQEMLLAKQKMRRTVQPRQAAFSTSFIMRQMPKEYLIIMSLPGLSKDEINLKLKGKYLTVSGEKDIRKAKTGENYRQEQVSSRSFLQVITLPDDSRKKDITSEYKEGNLTIRIPKELKAQDRPEGKKINID